MPSNYLSSTLEFLSQSVKIGPTCIDILKDVLDDILSDRSMKFNSFYLIAILPTEPLQPRWGGNTVALLWSRSLKTDKSHIKVVPYDLSCIYMLEIGSLTAFFLRGILIKYWTVCKVPIIYDNKGGQPFLQGIKVTQCSAGACFSQGSSTKYCRAKLPVCQTPPQHTHTHQQ